MPLSWQEAFLGSITGLGGIVATAVTIVKLKSSNPVMDIPLNVQHDISKLVENQTNILISLSKLDSQATHYKETLEELKADCKEDHMHIKLLHDWMVQFMAITKDDRLPPLEPRKR
jgi:hypothetical protein